MRDRLEDIEPLVHHTIEKVCAETGDRAKEISDEFWATLRAYPWPGNVRELKHAIRRALAAARENPVIYSRHLPTQIRIKAAQQGLDAGALLPSNVTAPFPKLKDYRDNAEREYVEMLLERTGRSMTQAAEAAGVSRGYLYELFKKHGIKR